jgi:hypothetical protein
LLPRSALRLRPGLGRPRADGQQQLRQRLARGQAALSVQERLVDCLPRLAGPARHGPGLGAGFDLALGAGVAEDDDADLSDAGNPVSPQPDFSA